MGALGYVVKAHAGSELLAAVEAVLQGRQFVSSGIIGSLFRPRYGFAILSSAPKGLSRRLHWKERRSRTATGLNSIPMMTAFVVGFTRFIEAALESGNAVIVIATESHRKNLLQRLREHGVDIVAAVEQGRYISLDVADTLSTFMVNDRPDPARFLKVAGSLVAAAAKASKARLPSRCSLWRMCSYLMGTREGGCGG